MKEKIIRNIYYYKNYYLDFFNSIDFEVRQKFNWTLKLISTVEESRLSILNILRVPLVYTK